MKTIVVTGASSGIGRAVAERFLAEGWAVGLVARRERALHTLARNHPNAHVLPCDVADPDAVQSGFDTLMTSTNQPDAVNVNLTAMFLCARSAFGRWQTRP